MYFLMSIKPEYAELILSGVKKTEIRRTRVKALPGDVVLIYATLPRGQIVGYFTINQVSYDSPQIIWNSFGSQTCLSHKEYHDYTKNKSSVCAISISNPVTKNGLRLSEINMHIPQSYMRISEERFLSLCACN